MNKALWLFAIAIPAFSLPTGAPPGSTGAPGDRTCAACHRTFPLNPEGGSVRIQAAPYKTGQTQKLRVTVSHPESQRWGFQITARWAKDPSQTAGVFAAPNTDVQVQANNYVTHTVAGTVSGGANGAKTFEVDWTPPEGADDSDIIFYAAGNAANNTAGNTGDRIYTTQIRIQADVTCGFTERPVVLAVVDAASYSPAVSPGALVAISGRGFASTGRSRDARLGYVRDDSFPKELGCVAVEIGGQRVPVLYVGENQINVQAPVTQNFGNLPVRVIMNADRPNAVSGDGSLRMQSASPAFFTFNGRSVAARFAGTGTSVADPSILAEGRRARPGDVLELYATGLGPTEISVAPGALAPPRAVPTTQRVAIMLGNTRLGDSDVLYTGLAPGNISGLYQINVRVPAGTAAGEVPVLITIGSEQSVAGTTIPVQ